ncbi:MAG: methyltransferase family protein [Promethearchaeota archaeon]
MPHEHTHSAGEARRSHTIQLGLCLFFIIVWILDSFIFRFTAYVYYFPFFLNIPTAIPVFIVAAYLMSKSHIVFEGSEPHVVDHGVYAHLRHPMYLGSILLYAAFWITTLSLLTLIPLLAVIIAYNYLASREEELLETKFGDEYLTYKKRVRKWIPR